MAATKDGEKEAATATTIVSGRPAVLHCAGAMFLPESRCLVVSDLHLEKGAAYARRGQLLPPWDTLSTLKLLESVIAAFDPAMVISLGDTFHDRVGADEMPADFRAMVGAMARGREWIWIVGNHDPDGVGDLPGQTLQSVFIDGLVFRHEPGPAPAQGEVAGHLHPAATLIRRERAVRRPCFASDGQRMIMPSFGVMTGGLDLRHQAFAGLFDRQALLVHMLGRDRIYPVRFNKLRG